MSDAIERRERNGLKTGANGDELITSEGRPFMAGRRVGLLVT